MLARDAWGQEDEGGLGQGLGSESVFLLQARDVLGEGTDFFNIFPGLWPASIDGEGLGPLGVQEPKGT